jgi:L-ascorbate metabolism protein UlaG (beta-lactamase superfamily)
MKSHLLLSIAWLALSTLAQEKVRFESASWRSPGELHLRVVNAAAARLTLERSTNLGVWEPLMTTNRTAVNEFVDSGASYRTNAYYRVREVEDPGVLTGDHLTTSDGPLTIHPVNHASFVIGWKDLLIYNDPVGGAARYNALPRANLVLVSHEHGDHFDSATLNAVRYTNGTTTTIIAPQAVYTRLSANLRAITTVLTNGGTAHVHDIQIEAVPAYNANHPRGAGNGYIVTIGDRRLYMAGDTGNIAEMRDFADIDAAFICMNVPFTMNVTQAAAIVREFAPKAVYPYHFRNQDGTFANLAQFRQQVGTDLGIEVRVRKWY